MKDILLVKMLCEVAELTHEQWTRYQTKHSKRSENSSFSESDDSIQLDSLFRRIQSDLLQFIKDTFLSIPKDATQALVGKVTRDFPVQVSDMILSVLSADSRDELVDSDVFNEGVPAVTKDQIEIHIREHYGQLADRLEAQSIAKKMFQQKALTRAELQAIQAKRSKPVKAAECLLDILMRHWNRIGSQFLDALIKVDQDDIYLELCGIELPCDVQQLIQNGYTDLIDRIDSTNSGLLPKLLSDGVIDLAELQEIEAAGTNHRMNEKLLSILSTKTQKMFDVFLGCLAFTGQTYIADAIRCNSHYASSHSASSVRETSTMGVGLTPSHPVRTGTYDQLDNEEQQNETFAIGTQNNQRVNKGTQQHTVDDSETSRKHYIPTVTFVRSLPEGDSCVYGLTVLDKQLYVKNNSSYIAVYNTDTYELQRRLSVPGLVGVTDMTSCRHHRCLYIASSTGEVVHRVEVDTTYTDDRFTLWDVGDEPSGLSVNADHNVIVTCCKVNRIKVFTPFIQLLTVVDLREVVHPVHTIQLASDKFVVCHGGYFDGKIDPLQRVCIVDGKGNVQESFGSSRGSDEYHVNGPVRLAVVNGFVLVTDSNNGRVLMLSPSLRCIQAVVSKLSGYPVRICFDDQTGLLYLADDRYEDDSWTTGHVNVYSVDNELMISSLELSRL